MRLRFIILLSLYLIGLHAEDNKNTFNLNMQYEATLFTPINLKAELFNPSTRIGLSAKFAHFENSTSKYKFNIVDLNSTTQLYKIKFLFLRMSYNAGLFYRYCSEEGIRGYDREYSLFDGPGDDPFREGSVISHNKHAIGVSVQGSNWDYKYFSISGGYKFGMYFLGKSHFISQEDWSFFYSQDRFFFLDMDLLTISFKFPFSGEYKESYSPFLTSDSLDNSGFKVEYGFYKSRFPSVFGGISYGISTSDLLHFRAGITCRPFVMASEDFFFDELEYEEMSMASFLEFPIIAEVNLIDQISVFGGVKISHIFSTEQTIDVSYRTPRLQYTKSLSDIERNYYGLVLGGMMHFKNFDIGLRYNAVGKKLVIPRQEVNAVEELYLPEIEYSLSGMEVFIRHSFF